MPAAAVSERAGEAPGARAGRVPGLHPLRAGPVLGTLRPEPLEAAGARSVSGCRSGPGPGFGPVPTRGARTFLPGVPRAARGGGPAPDSKPGARKNSRGRISTSQRADQAGQRGSSPRPTAEGPGSGRAPSPAGPQAPLSCTLPPYVLPPGHLRGVVSPKLKLQRRGWNFLGSSRPCCAPWGWESQRLWSEGRWGLALSPPSVNTETAGLWQLLPKTPLPGAPGPRGVAGAEPEAPARCLEAGLLLAGELGRWRDPSS